MFTLDDYVGRYEGSPDWNEERKENAKELMSAVAALMKLAEADGVVFHVNPITRSIISGQGRGGFRDQACTIGAPKSKHKQGKAVDLYDPDGKIDEWCMSNLHHLKSCGIWLENPGATQHWAHWQSVPPGSGNRVFMP